MTAVAFAAALGTAGAAHADCGEVSITEMDWASSAVVTHVANFLMTNGLIRPNVNFATNDDYALWRLAKHYIGLPF